MRLLCLLLAVLCSDGHASFSRAILHGPNDRFAAHELRRYVLKTTGSLCTIIGNDDGAGVAGALQTFNETLVLGTPDSHVLSRLARHLSLLEKTDLVRYTASFPRNHGQWGLRPKKLFVPPT